MSTAGDSATDLERDIVTGFADSVAAAYECLTRFDQHSGDGDFGDNLRGGVVVAVTSNIAHANTPSLARRVGDAFAEQTR